MRHLSFRAKTVFVVLLAAGVAVVVACGIFLALDRVSYRDSLVEKLDTQCKIIAANSTAALSFGDPDAAGETLAALAAEEIVAGARIFTLGGEIFSSYERPEAHASLPAAPLGEGSRVLGGRLLVEHPIVFEGETLGAVVIEASLQPLAARTRRFAAIVGLVLLASLALAYVIASRMQRSIVGPVLSLAATADRVSRERDYGLRAQRVSDDEVGALTGAFNHMLAEIQAQQQALERSHELLEQRVEERTRSLVDSESRFRSLSDHAPIGIFQVDHARHVVYVNPCVEALLAVSDATGRSLCDIICAADARQWQRLCGRFEARESVDVELEIRVGDDARWIHMRAIPLDGEAAGYVGTIADVTERRVADAEREVLHRERLELSRQAGMAEIATSVLHNVGNVLNSVNVSAALVSDRVRGSRVGELGKLVRLLEEQDDLARFVSEDRRGQMIPKFLSALAEVLQGEQREVVTETESLVRNVEHIKKIVTMQQSFARVAGVVEPCEVDELIEDAVSLVSAGLHRHHIELHRGPSIDRTISVDKHKVLQILVNLLSNAKHAVLDESAAGSVITIRASVEDGCVRIEVEDTGAGIARENLDRIFAYGFTTRAEGHGFGLHGSAIAARQLGGRLLAESAGPGQGARFVLQLPAAQQASVAVRAAGVGG